MLKFRCENCNEAEFETEHQLRGHHMKCRPVEHKETKARNERIPMGMPVQRFKVPENDGFEYRVFNDNWRKEPGRIERAKRAGWEFYEHERSGESVGTNDDGSEIKGVLMRIPKELYDQDQAFKQRKLDEIDAQIHKGKYAQGRDDKRYLPSGNIRIETKLTG